jgi:hypothetical protein
MPLIKSTGRISRVSTERVMGGAIRRIITPCLFVIHRKGAQCAKAVPDEQVFSFASFASLR